MKISNLKIFVPLKKISLRHSRFFEKWELLPKSGTARWAKVHISMMAHEIHKIISKILVKKNFERKFIFDQKIAKNLYFCSVLVKN